LEGFLQEFPDYIGRDTWLSGESYAGVYIPTLTAAIINHTDSTIYGQLTGLTMGNPVISCESADYNAIQFNLFYWHGLVSHLLWANWTLLGCNEDSSSDGCDQIFDIAVDQIGVIYQQLFPAYPSNTPVSVASNDQPSLDPDDLYQDFCIGNGTLDFADNVGYPTECYPVGSAMTDYLNRVDVQDAIGVPPTLWAECSSTINYTSTAGSMIPFYNNFFDKLPGLKVLVYSGDVDIFTVPFGYTQACLAELDQDLESIWQPWFVNGATAGYYEVFEDFVYATIKGAGHESPQYQPLTSFNMFQRFTQGESLSHAHNPSVPNVRIPARRTQGVVLKQHGIRG